MSISDETRRKISESLTGREFSESHKANIRKAARGRVVSEETRRKISESLKGRKLSKEHKANISKSCEGRVYEREVYERAADSRRGVPLSDAHKAAIGDAKRGGVISEAQKRKISEGLKAHWARVGPRVLSEEQKRKIGDANRGRVFTEEHKRKISESVKLSRMKVRRLRFPSECVSVGRAEKNAAYIRVVLLRGEKVVLNFSDVQDWTATFFIVLFRELCMDMSVGYLVKRIKFRSISTDIKDVINDVMTEIKEAQAVCM